MDCPNCSHKNIAGAQFCGNCGFTLIAESVVPVAQTFSQPQAPIAPGPATVNTAEASTQLPPAPQPQAMPVAPQPVQAQPPSVPTAAPAPSDPYAFGASPAPTAPQPVASSLPQQSFSPQLNGIPAPQPITSDAPVAASYQPQATPASAVPAVAPPLPENGLVKDRISQVKTFVLVSIILGALFTLMYLFIIFTAEATSNEMQATGQTESTVPAVVLVVVGAIGLVGAALSIIGGVLGNKATTIPAAKKATMVAIIGQLIMVALAGTGSLFGLVALGGFIVAFMARRALKQAL